MGTRVREWLAVVGVILLHVVLYAALFLLFESRLAPHQMFWYFLAVVYADAGLLGVWLAAGQTKAWLRFTVTLVGVSALVATAVSALPPVHVLVLAPSIVATTALAAFVTLGLGCLGSLVPTAARWQLRFALWEIVVSICLIGVSMAILRLVAEANWINFNQWYGGAGGHFLAFGIISGAFVAASAIPLLLTGKRFRRISAAGVLLLWGIVPIAGWGVFGLLGLSGGDLDLFYPAHAGQLFVAWVTLFMLDFGINGLFRRAETALPEQNRGPTAAAPASDPRPDGDFFNMQ